ncbi:MAG: hypothetical protein K6G62_07055 [Eubacterium sp.]|nr:hypothetical protein [Eubacterium sp.]
MRRIYLLLALTTIFCVACGGQNNIKKAIDERAGVSEAAVTVSEPAVTEEANQEGPVDYSQVDLDLTNLNATMIYAEVYNIVTSPDSYVGQTIKMSGLFDTTTDEATGKQYFACIIPDATACCTQGIEFSLAGKKSYPEDYPKPGDKFTVVGVFSTYQEGGMTYCQLTQAKIVK